MEKSLEDHLSEETRAARARVYHAGQATPIQPLLGQAKDFDVFIKREDLGPINAYKWRGAYNAVAAYHEKKECQTVVAASAGNHAQGVALAARKLGLKATIFMPLSTPVMKQISVKRHGGDHVDIRLYGDTYNEAAEAARAYVEQNALTYIHPFDDIFTMAGQATIADEIIADENGPYDFIFLQIGGGGMAAAVAAQIKRHNSGVRIIGVEGVDQASMKASVENGAPVTLANVDTFCDGTAVTRPGNLTFELCRKYIDAYVTVSNEEVSSAIQRMWESSRVVPEPSGAMGLAGLIRYADENADDVRGKKLLAILCGANMDFSKLSMIAQRSAIGAHRRRYLRFHINEESGGLLRLLDTHFRDVNVSEFLYGKIDENDAWPIIGLEAAPDRIEAIVNGLRIKGVGFEDVSLDADIRYRIINYNPALFHDPILMHIQFPERKGALRELMRGIVGIANVCYFNYAYTGETIGRAIMGFELKDGTAPEAFFRVIENSPVECTPVEPSVASRILHISRNTP